MEYEYSIGGMPARGEPPRLTVSPTSAHLFIRAADALRAKQWLKQRYIQVSGPIAIGGVVKERTVFALCSRAEPLADGELICELTIAAAAHAESDPRPDADVLRALVDLDFPD